MGTPLVINMKQLLAATYGQGIVKSYVLSKEELNDRSSNVTVIGGSGTSRAMPWKDGDEKGDGTGALGLPIFQKVVFKQSGKEPLFLGDTLVSFSLSRTIVKTQVNGLDGTIKEFISNNDYKVNIKGFLVSDNPYKAPEKQIRAFRQWFAETKRQIQVEGRMFDVLRISSIVVEDFDLPKLPGYVGLQPYEINALSDFNESAFLRLKE